MTIAVDLGRKATKQTNKIIDRDWLASKYDLSITQPWDVFIASLYFCEHEGQVEKSPYKFCEKVAV